VATVRALIPPQPGALEGMDFDELRVRLGTSESDAVIMQACLDDGLEFEE